MIHLQNVSAQKVSWVKSNKEALEKHTDAIKNLYYPETIEELKDLVAGFYRNGIYFDIIGYSSNTLFLPSYSVEHLICTKKLDRWIETNDSILCDCGVNVAKLSKEMVKKGYEGFYGLIDLPGTIASGVYGNCGCYHCNVCDLLKSITFMDESGLVKTLYVNDLELKYRSSNLKRKEKSGVILQVSLYKRKGIPSVELAKAKEIHNKRQLFQPQAANNLGTTFLGQEKTFKCKVIDKAAKVISLLTRQDMNNSIKAVLVMMGKKKFVKYIFYCNRFLFLDALAHEIFPDYIRFINTLYKDSHLEIEIKK